MVGSVGVRVWSGGGGGGGEDEEQEDTPDSNEAVEKSERLEKLGFAVDRLFFLCDVVEYSLSTASSSCSC